MFTNDRTKIESSRTGYFPTINSIYSMIPRETRLHMERVGRYSETIFRFLLRVNPSMIENEMMIANRDEVELLFRYHDIGRFFIPVSILNKVERLTDEEFQIIKDHAMNAIPAIESIYKKPFSDESMMEWMNIAVYHHERWDGNGYPEGKKEAEIPLSARICAIADTYDGITSWKPYKKQQTTREEAISIIRKEAGKQFDPYLVDVFRACAIEL